jgi:hypothetical protein
MESHLHKHLKHTIAQELQRKNYTLYFEAHCSPFSRLLWNSYCPDILGVLENKNSLKIILVECETKPTKKRVIKKTIQIKQVLSLQKRLNEKHVILPLLAIPAMNLYKVNGKEIRNFWEIWIINQSGEILHKLFRSTK